MRRPMTWVLAGLIGFAYQRAAAADGPEKVKIGERHDRKGDEIVVCGERFHTTAPVVLWTDPGGYDAYRVERRFAPLAESSWEATSKATRRASPSRFGMMRKAPNLTPELVERVRGGGWRVEELREVVDQFVIHFDACGTSRRCFEVLHDIRGLSVHFLLDLDGTIYQTLDVKERAWHATIANDRSVGVEVANIGAYPDPPVGADVLTRWYATDHDGKTRLTIPGGAVKAGERDPSLALRPERDRVVAGEVQAKNLRQYDFTPQQYDSLIKLTATLCTVLPRIKCDYPRDASGKLVNRKLDARDYANYQGVLGHYHVQLNKVDPGPAFQWDKLIDGARSSMKP